MPVLRAEPANDLLVIEHMREVLSGDLSSALANARRFSDARGREFVNELTDMARGSYATTGNRSYQWLAPLWQAAQTQHINQYPVASGRLPLQVLSLSSQTRSVLIVDTSQSVARLLHHQAAGWVLRHSAYVSVGSAGVGKQKRWDRKTPLGVFELQPEQDVSRLPARYGARVLPLNYPTALDRHLGRTGDGIWLHGIDPANNIRPPRDTDGCIALDNKQIGLLAELLESGTSLVIVATDLTWQPSSMRSPLLGDIRVHLADYLRAERIDANANDADVVLADATEGIWLTRVHRKNKNPLTIYWQRVNDHWQAIVASDRG